MSVESMLPLNLVPGLHRSEIDRIFHAAFVVGASDISIQTNDYVMFMINGNQVRASTRTIQEFEVVNVANEIYGANGAAKLSQGDPIDPRYEINPSRGERIGFRINMTPSRVDGNDRAISITARVMPKNPPTVFDIGVPEEIMQYALPRNGLVVVAGVTSSGKSTFISSVMRYQYEMMEANSISSPGRKMITYEAPIEYVFDGLDTIGPKISQTEITSEGGGLRTWAEAVETAVRRAPSIILFGECRDAETMNGCVSMALAGHCTMTTTHADTVGGTFRRMVNLALKDGVSIESVTERLLGSTSMIIVQSLSPKIGGGRIALREWLVMPKSLKDRLFDLDPASVANELQRETVRRGTSMGHSAALLMRKGLISDLNACAFSGLIKDELDSIVVDPLKFKNFEKENINADP